MQLICYRRPAWRGKLEVPHPELDHHPLRNPRCEKRNREVDKEFSSRLRQAEQQQAVAREMIKTAREMVDRAIAMRERVRGFVLP